ncbi:hypothetical protein SAMN05421823_107229 [Catalinimonas alkaloidigena]|uniref:YcxB-like C-terminal domain-containing protein n=2 Tax=Catalinimonas alkaloidigena TaxID=1075417 RepID=A0A1G9M2E7_9BACT|nr:hypothetical protein SAMN05421823_107229 [Catalinimonas alkaloidigena]
MGYRPPYGMTEQNLVGVKTKKYQLETSKYIKLAFLEVLRQQWWVFLIAVGVAAVGFIFPKAAVWFIVAAVVGLILYLLFWLVQFVGVTQLDQFKVMFERFSYELNGKTILMRVNAKEGMQFSWDNIKKAEKQKDAFMLHISRAQFIYLPFSIFNSEHDLRLTEALLRRKNLLPPKPEATNETAA